MISSNIFRLIYGQKLKEMSMMVLTRSFIDEDSSEVLFVFCIEDIEIVYINDLGDIYKYLFFN